MRAAETSPLSIAITYPYPLGEQATGGPRLLREIAWGLAKLGARVYVLAVSSNMSRRTFPRAAVPRQLEGYDIDQAYLEHGVRLDRVDQHPFHYQLDGLGVRRAIARIATEEHLDMVLGLYHEAAFLPDFLEERGIGFGYLAIWQTYAPLREPLRGIGGLFWRWIRERTILRPMRAADLHCAISGFTRDELLEVLGVSPERIVVTPLGVDSAFTDIERRAPTSIGNLIYFGRYHPSKGFLDAIEALGRLAAAGRTGCRLRMFGAGRHDLAEAKARQHGVADRVEIHDAVGDELLKRELERADLALLPSHAESFGLSIAEAQASALPVVSYRAGAVPELIEHGVTGWLAPLGDVEELARLLGTALDRPQEAHRIGLAARHRIGSEFTWEHTARGILDAVRRCRSRKLLSQRPLGEF